MGKVMSVYRPDLERIEEVLIKERLYEIELFLEQAELSVDDTRTIVKTHIKNAIISTRNAARNLPT